MIVFANGAFKSGSTWLFNIARELTSYGPPPSEYANPAWTSQPVYSIDRHRLAAFLDEYSDTTNHILVKNHFGSLASRDRLLRYPNVRVLNITRDIRDVVVSAYYHRRITKNMNDQERFTDFQSYYWNKGRYIAQEVLDYQIVWDVRSPRYLCVAYARMLADCAGEVQRIGQFLGMPPTSAQIERILQATSPAALSAQQPHSDFNRFRMGIIGDWRNHFDDTIAADMAAISRRSRNPLHRQAIVGPRPMRFLCRPWRNISKREKQACTSWSASFSEL